MYKECDLRIDDHHEVYLVRYTTFFLLNMSEAKYKKDMFEAKVIKRGLEDKLSEIKYQHLGNFRASALSLTGPAIEDHVENFKKCNVEHVYIAESSQSTFSEMVKDNYYLNNLDYVSLNYIDVFDYFKQLESKPVILKDIDLDFTITINTLLPTLYKELPTMLNSECVNDTFTLTVTFCHRKSRNTLDHLEELDLFISKYCKINTRYYHSYRDSNSPPMVSQMYLLEKNTLGDIGPRISIREEKWYRKKKDN